MRSVYSLLTRADLRFNILFSLLTHIKQSWFGDTDNFHRITSKDDAVLISEMLLRHVAEDSPELCVRSSAPIPEVLLFLILFFAGIFFFFPIRAMWLRHMGLVSGKYLFLNGFKFIVIKTVCVYVRERERGKPVEVNYRIERWETADTGQRDRRECLQMCAKDKSIHWNMLG